MKRLAGIAVSVAAVSFSFAADDPNAPLANAKQELKQLQRDEAAKKTGAADEKLKGALPTLNAPVPGQSEIDLSSSLKASREESARKQQEARKNWLLDGYDGLEAKGKTRTKGGGRPDGREDAIDSRDPDYVQKIYARQKKAEDDEKNRTDGARKTGTAASAGADPLAPFLKDWLANSPVKDAALDAMGRREAAGVKNPADEMFSSAGTGSGVATAQPGGLHPEGNLTGKDATAANPFLQALTLPSAMRAGPAGPVRQATVPPAVLPAPKPMLATPTDVAPPARNDSHKPPPSQRDEDKKYFPQLKRF